MKTKKLACSDCSSGFGIFTIVIVKGELHPHYCRLALIMYHGAMPDYLGSAA